MFHGKYNAAIVKLPNGSSIHGKLRGFTYDPNYGLYELTIGNTAYIAHPINVVLYSELEE